MTRCFCVLAMLLLAGCAHDRARQSAPGSPVARGSVHDNIQLPQSERYARKHDAGPDDVDTALQRVYGLVEPVPRVEPRSRYGNGPNYTVRGHTYHVLASARGYHAQGIASWYGNKFQGHLTSSLEPYDMYKFTAAHKTLPLPSYVRVTNLANGKSVIVRVNDRGPFHDNRLIDLSWAAAVRLGMWRQGTARVAVEGLDPRQRAEPSAPDVVPVTGQAPILYLQVGAFADNGRARHMRGRLRSLGVAGVHLEPAQAGGRRLWRVRIGPLQGKAELQRLRRTLQQNDIASIRVTVDPSSEE